LVVSKVISPAVGALPQARRRAHLCHLAEGVAHQELTGVPGHGSIADDLVLEGDAAADRDHAGRAAGH